MYKRYFRLFKNSLKGIFESKISVKAKIPVAIYPIKVLINKKESIKEKLPMIFVLGSS